MDPAQVRLVYVLGASFSGSTLLNTLLARHSGILGLNELVNLGRELRDQTPNNPRHPLRQPFWQRVQAAYEHSGGPPFRELRLEFTRAHEGRADEDARWAEHHARLFTALRSVAGDAWVVDSSKHHRRLRQYLRHGYRPVVLHAVRDGRGVVASGRSRQLGLLRMIAEVHHTALRAAEARWPAMRRSLPWLTIRHQVLVADPARVLQVVCDRLGLPFEPAMLELTPVLHPEAVGAKGFWMLRRPKPIQARAPNPLPTRDEWVYRLLGGPVRDRLLGVDRPSSSAGHRSAR
jgi:hypothetical protein